MKGHKALNVKWDMYLQTESHLCKLVILKKIIIIKLHSLSSQELFRSLNNAQYTLYMPVLKAWGKWT